MLKKINLFLLIFLITGTKLFAQKETDILAYIYAYKDIAIKEMLRTGVPAAIKLAQGIHETEAGKSDLVLRSNNHFGIKCKSSWSGNKVYHDDDARGECFRSYNKAEESYMDHSDFLKNSARYAFLFQLDPIDYEGWAYGLKKAGYATNIRYSHVIINIIRKYNLQDYSLIALGKMNESDHMIASVNGKKVFLPIISTTEKPVESNPVPDVKPSYPQGQFAINSTRVIYASANTPWLTVAQQYNIPLSRLLDFNDLESDDDILLSPQLIYLQRKRKVGGNEFHLVKVGESLYDICQLEGIRFESLLDLNHLNGSRQPAPGEKLNLQYSAAAAPLVIDVQIYKLSLSRSWEKDAAHFSVNPGNNTQVNNERSGPVNTPEFTTHFVAIKETLYSISKKYGVELEKIMKWNSLDSMNVKIGQSLIIYKNN